MNYEVVMFIVTLVGFIASLIQIYMFFCTKDIHLHISFIGWVPYIHIAIVEKSKGQTNKEGFHLFLKKVYQKGHAHLVNAVNWPDSQLVPVDPIQRLTFPRHFQTKKIFLCNDY